MPKKKAACITHVKVKELSAAKVKALNAFILSKETDQEWDASVSQLAALFPSEVHHNVMAAMLSALGLDEGDSFDASCEFIMAGYPQLGVHQCLF